MGDAYSAVAALVSVDIHASQTTEAASAMNEANERGIAYEMTRYGIDEFGRAIAYG